MKNGMIVYKKLIELRTKDPQDSSFKDLIAGLSDEELLSLTTAVFAGRLMFEGLANDAGRITARARDAAKKMSSKSKEPMVNYLCTLPQNSFFRFFEMARSLDGAAAKKS